MIAQHHHFFITFFSGAIIGAAVALYVRGRISERAAAVFADLRKTAQDIEEKK